MPAPSLEKVSRKQFLRELMDFASQQRDLVEASVGGFAVDPKASAARVEKCKTAYGLFCTTYFPHYVRDGLEPSVFQAWVHGTFPTWARTPGTLQPVAAPRGEAKSTLLTQIGCVYLVVYGLAHMVPLIMGTTEQAEEMLEVVKAELEANPRLRMDFPDACGRGRIWRAGVIITANNIKVKAYGAGKSIRGARNGPWRPDFIFLDDLENDENVKSKDQRDKLEEWIKKTVLNLGPPDGSLCVMYMGTILHYDSVLARFLKSPLWKSRAQKFRSIITWPDRMDLWDKWEEQLLNEGEDAAQAFYVANERDMLIGAVVSWPAVRPLLQLMKRRADGHKAFDTEQQNDPTAGEDCPFSGCIQFWVHPSRDWVFYGAHDPSMGKKSKRNDPSATLVGGYDRNHGKLSIVEARIARRKPDRQIEDIIALQEEWGCLLWGIESVAFQEFFRTELMKRAAEKHQHVPARGIVSSDDKDLRIEGIQPYVADGFILLGHNQRTLFEQLDHWPEADHDDGPDCLEMLWQIARRGQRRGAKGARTGRRRESAAMLSGYGEGA